jgi:hypothetical protein
LHRRPDPGLAVDLIGHRDRQELQASRTSSSDSCSAQELVASTRAGLAQAGGAGVGFELGSATGVQALGVLRKHGGVQGKLLR